jgi:hypothetical protein
VSYPFVYLDHGALDPDSFDKAESIWIAFQAPVPEAERRAIMKRCPAAFAGFFRWDDVLFYSESAGDVYSAIVADEFGDGGSFEVTAEAARRFSRAVEAWVLEIHTRAPIAFFIGPSRAWGDDAWNAWSYARVGSVIVPWLESYLDTHPALPDEVEEAGEDGFGDELTEEDELEPIASPMDRATLAYIAQHLDAEDLTDDERARAHALSVRLGWASEDD